MNKKTVYFSNGRIIKKEKYKTLEIIWRAFFPTKMYTYAVQKF